MSLVIGSDNFGKIISNKYDFVDKSLFIKEVLDDAVEVLLITRPRRFGKTLNLSMLHHFLSSTVDDIPTKGLFDNLKIAQLNDYMQQQGKFPVIFITFKDIKEREMNMAYDKLHELIIKTFSHYSYLEKSDKLDPNLKQLYQLILYRKANKAQIEDSLQTLTACLYQHHKVKPWILIDEYDTPIQASYINGYYEEMISLMRGLFSAALKTNTYLHKAVITGVLRIAKESLFSGLNNLKVYSVLRSKYGQYFGFTEDEVLDLLKQVKIEDRFEETKRWYDGYSMGEVNVYNPWSIVNSIEDREFRPYWVNTGDTTLIKTLMAQADVSIKKKFESILQNQPVEALIDENLVFGDLYDDKKDAIWSLLLFSGYLKASSCEYTDYAIKCSLQYPNHEVLYIYRQMVHEWFTDKIGYTQYNQFLESLIKGRIDEFTYMLKDFLLESASVFDVKDKYPERFYHGFVMGLIVSLRESHLIKSNRESGLGRYDVMMIPKDRSQLGIILEFKVARNNEVDLEESAKEALHQIEERQYEAELKQNGIDRILKLGLAFRGKEVSIQEEKNT